MDGAVAAPRPAAITATCDHCGLASAPGDRFCCFGCELAAQIADEAATDHSRAYGTVVFSTLLAMAVMMLSLFLYAGDVYGDAEGLGWLRAVYRVAAGVLATPVMLLCGVPLSRRALRQLRRGRLSMELLIGGAATSAYAISMVALFSGGAHVYFESAAAALVLATAGRYLEATARSRASGLLGATIASRGQLVRLADGRQVPAAKVEAGACFVVDVEHSVPVDATVTGEPVEVDRSVLTGESAPITLRVGDSVPAGAVVVAGRLTAVATRSVHESTLEQLAEAARTLGERASGSARLADKLAAALLPTVALVALAAFAWWTAHDSLGRGVVVALAVTLVACPCTYGIAAPLVLWLSLRRAMFAGVLVRRAETLEVLARVHTVAFDKTGTLTDVTAALTERSAPETEVLALVAALEAGTHHPVGKALAALAEGHDAASVTGRRVVVGRGVEATDALGRAVAIAAEGDEGAVALSRAGEVVARFGVQERVRDDARAAVDALAAAGVEAVILSGDDPARTQRVGAELGVPVAGGLSPAGKVEHLDALEGPVAMVGDGLNDAPALAATVSFAVDSGVDLSRGVASVALRTADLRLVPWTLAVARRSVTLIRRLIWGSTVYNAAFVGLAAAGALRPVWAGIAMLGASLMGLAAAASASHGARVAADGGGV